ncbi:recombinase family protein [Nocardioides ochotonae]|uniref:recombinase family protein n=1 Tax=Nocardioides ochotonae TaxID=2685869 RepID=UPI0014073C76|nr:recombinase family protein [Nocardioides ochotonae]
MAKRKPTRAVIYLRLSQASETSVSIARQREACEEEARRLGLDVVLVAVDDGVSGSKTAPLDRRGFRQVCDLDRPWDVLIVWSLDRLVRNIASFWDTHNWLEARGKALVLCKERVDGSTTVGKMVLGLLAGIAQVEAENIAARVAAARAHLLTTGRSAGGATPYGWRNVDNPAGPGKVLAKDPAQAPVVRRILTEAAGGGTMYGIAKGLTDDGVPAPSWRGVPFALGRWHHSQVERVVRHPVCAGMVPHNPGNVDTKRRGEDVVRDERGMPRVYPDLAALPVAEWRALVASLDGRDSPQARPRAMKSSTSPLLSGLMWCRSERHDGPVRMWRGTIQGREGYVCRAKGCNMVISNFEDALVEHVLGRVGGDLRWQRVQRVVTGGEAELPEIELALDDLSAKIRAAGSADERRRLREREDALLELRDARRAEGGEVEWVQVATDRTFREDYEAAATVEERRAVLDDCVERVEVRRGRPGRRTAGQMLERLTLVLKPTPTWHDPDEGWLGVGA